MGTSASRLSRKMSPTKLFLLLFAFATEVQPEPTLNPESRISQYGHTVRNRPTVSGGHLQYRLALCTKGGSLVGWHAGGTCTLVKGKFLSISEPSTSVEAITEDSEGAVRIAPRASTLFTGPIRRVSDGKEQSFGAPDGIQTAVASSIALGSREQYGASANDCFFFTI